MKKTKLAREDKILIDVALLSQQERILLADFLSLKVEELYIKNIFLNLNDNKIWQEKQKFLLSGEPLDYLLSKIEVLGLEIILKKGTFIPRWETEEWVPKSLELSKKFVNEETVFLDLCAGSGIIGLYLAKKFPKNQVLAGEIDPKVIENILLNQKNNNIQNYKVYETNGLENSFFREKLEISQNWILYCNPPYVPEIDKKFVKENNIAEEPGLAIFGGEDGLEVFIRILQETMKLKNLPKIMFFELDPRNIKKAENILQEKGWKTKIKKDSMGLERVLIGWI